MLHEMQSRNMAPVAIIFNTVNPILAQGAAHGGISMLAGFDEDVTEVIPHGSLVEVDPDTKTLRVLRAGGDDTATATFAHGQSETSPVHLKPRN
jgi:predicted aconitase with swiveling domain